MRKPKETFRMRDGMTVGNEGDGHPQILNPFVLEEIPELCGRKLLDIGCGRGSWGFLMLVERGGSKGFMVGLDIQKKHLQFCKNHHVYDEVILGDAAHLPFRESSFDFVLASEVIEHLPKNLGFKLIKEAERVGRKIVITTPQGYQPRSQEIKGPNSHKSQWTSSDFQKMNYRVHGVGFRFFKWYMIAEKESSPPKLLYGALLYLFTPLSYVFPRLGEWLLAIKEQCKEGILLNENHTPLR